MRRAGLRSVACLVAAMLAGCAARVPARPAGTPLPDPSAVDAWVAATTHCRPLRTGTAEIALSGRVGGQRLRARLVSGFSAPDAVRLEALAPFGAPVFVLASDGRTTTLLFPRDHQVLRDTKVPDVLAAMTGLELGAGELRGVLFGCLGAGGTGTGGRIGADWQVVEADGARLYLRGGALVAADYRGWLVDYAPGAGGARTVRVRRGAAGGVDLSAVLSQVELNVAVPDEAFRVAVPADATPITIEDLRAGSPLATRESR